MIDYLNYPYFQPIQDLANCSFYYLYADPFLPTFNSMVSENIDKAFADYAQKVAAVKKGPFAYMFDVQEKLALVLEKKAKLGLKIKSAYIAKDFAALTDIASIEIPEIIKRLDEFFLSFDRRWREENMSAGFEMHCARIGALKYRLQYAAQVLLDYCAGKLDSIRDLETETLPFSYVLGMSKGHTEDTYISIWWDIIVTGGIHI